MEPNAIDPAVAGAAAGIGMGMVIAYLAICLLLIISLWKVFSKAGQPGWASIIPIYNAYVMLKVAGKPGWWLVLMLIPLVNVIIGIIAVIGLAANFGKGGGFTAGLILLPVIFLPMLAFGSAQYRPVAS